MSVYIYITLQVNVGEKNKKNKLHDTRKKTTFK